VNDQVIPLVTKFIINNTLSLEVRTTEKVLSRGTLGFQRYYVEMYNCTHTDTKNEPPHLCPDKGCLMVPTFPQCGSQIEEQFDWVPM
jgi:hypothetical protein